MASNKGAPTLETTKKFQQYTKDSRSSPIYFTDVKPLNDVEKLVNGEGVEQNKAFRLKNSTTYPSRPIATDDRATRWAMIQDLKGDQITSARPMPFTDADLQYLMDRESAEEYAAYEAWLGNRYNLNDPATKAIFKGMVPRYFERRKEILEEQMKDHARYARLVQTGPENEDDLMFQWTVETGRRTVPIGPFYDPFQWMMNTLYADKPAEAVDPAKATESNVFAKIATHNASAYKYGMFNPFKPTTPANAGYLPNPYNPTDIVGNPSVRQYGFPGAGVPTSDNWKIAYGGKDLTDRRDATAQGQNTNVSNDARFNIRSNPYAGQRPSPYVNRGTYGTSVPEPGTLNTAAAVGWMKGDPRAQVWP